MDVGFTRETGSLDSPWGLPYGWSLYWEDLTGVRSLRVGRCRTHYLRPKGKVAHETGVRG